MREFGFTRVSRVSAPSARGTLHSGPLLRSGGVRAVLFALPTARAVPRSAAAGPGGHLTRTYDAVRGHPPPTRRDADPVVPPHTARCRMAAVMMTVRRRRTCHLCNMLCIPKYENRNSRSRNPHTRRRTPTTAARPPRRRPRRRHGRRVGRNKPKPGGPNVWVLLSFSLTGGLELVSNIADRVPLSACKCKMVSKFDGLTTCKYASITSPSRGRYAEPLRVRTVCAYRGNFGPAVIPRSPKANFPKNAGSKRGHVSDTHLFARALSDAPEEWRSAG